MADEQYGWLDRETAERMLRGEPPEAVGADAREQAARLAEALGELSAKPPPTSDELPGEAAALAAFRAARADRTTARAEVLGALGGGGRDAGLYRLGAAAPAAARPRWTGPLRYVLAAALAVGTVGGVAVATGTGVLPTPFEPTAPGPVASVTTDEASLRPPATASPDGTGLPGTPGGGPGAGAGAGAGSRAGAGRDTARDGGDAPGERPTATVPGDGRGSGGGSAPTDGETVAACRAVRDGRPLATRLQHALEGAAGGAGRVRTYCEGLLAEAGSAAAGGSGVRDGSGERGRGEGDRGQGGRGERDGGEGGRGEGDRESDRRGGGSGSGDHHPGHGDEGHGHEGHGHEGHGHDEGHGDEGHGRAHGRWGRSDARDAGERG